MREKKFVNYYKIWLTKFNLSGSLVVAFGKRCILFDEDGAGWISFFFLLGGDKAFSQNDMIDPFDFVGFSECKYFLY